MVELVELFEYKIPMKYEYSKFLFYSSFTIVYLH